MRIKGRVKSIGFMKVMTISHWNNITVNWTDQHATWDIWS